MSLTTADLQAIKGIITTAVPPIVETIVDEKIEAAMRQTAAGFAAVDEQFMAVHARLDKHESILDKHGGILETMAHNLRIIRTVQAAESQRLDNHEGELRRIQKKLKLA